MPGLPVPGAEWAGFQIEQRIGAGSTGAVFLARDRSDGVDGRRVALKVLSSGAAADATARERFLGESRTAAGLDHPCIVPILDVGEHDGAAYVVMDHIAGGDLAQEIHVSPLTMDRTRSVMGQLATALDHVHRAGLVHRGVEPANVLCSADSDDVFLTDFGAPAASLRYAAPEQVRGEAVTPATDVYGLGCTLFECLTGRVPFPGDTPEVVADQQLSAPPPRVTELRPDLPTDVDDIVARAMAKDPAERHPTSRHLSEAVALLRVDEPPTLGITGISAAAFPATAASIAVASGPEAEVSDEPPASRSVFDETSVLPTVATPERPVDGAAFGIYEDDGRRRRTPMVIAVLFVVAILGVGALAWRAVNTDADLASDTSASTTTTEAAADTGPVAPTIDALQALVPEGVDTCVAPEGEAASADPIVFQCPLGDVPESLSLELFSTDAARDERLEAFAAVLEPSDRDDAECALGRTGRHPFESEATGGTVLCTASAGRVDFVWTRDDAPVLFHASGGGRFADYEDAWERFAERTDAAFPTDAEQPLLDALPDALVVDCARDLPLVLGAGGEVAAACRPPDVEPNIVSWVLFSDDDPMDAWIEERRASLDENNFDTTDDGCTPAGFGQVEAPIDVPVPEEGEGAGPDQGVAPPAAGPPPDAAFVDYDLDGSSGRVLCFVNTSGQNALFWTRDGSRIGSIAVSDQSDGASMTALLQWWRDGGHLP